MTLRVCHLGKYYPPARGGMESHVQTLAQAQAAAGLSVQVICVNHERGPTRRERDGAVLVTRLSRLGTAAKLDLCPDLLGTVARTEADVFHVHVPNPIMILATLACRSGPLVVTYQSDHVHQKLRARIFSPIERRFYERASAIVATTALYAEGSPTLRAFARKVQVVPLGIDLAPFVEPEPAVLAEARRIEERYPRPLWFSCGRLVSYKGLETALDAIERVPGTLLVVGDGPELERLRARAHPRVHFLGSVSDVRPFYRAARALWFPSNAKSEAYGLVQIEAMASGCPVINCAIPGSGVPWVSRDGESGLTVPVNDSRAFADAAERLARDDALHARLVAGGRARVSLDFDHRAMVRRLMPVYERVAGAVA